MATTNTVKYLAEVADKDSDTNARKQEKTAKKRQENSGGGGGGGGEVYNMINLNNRCLLDREMVDKIKSIANPSSPSVANYYIQSCRGTRFYSSILGDIQKHMNLYYKAKKINFPKKSYRHAFECMEVYIKTMYLVERGLLQSNSVVGDSMTIDVQDTRKVNILWGDSMSKF